MLVYSFLLASPFFRGANKRQNGKVVYEKGSILKKQQVLHSRELVSAGTFSQGLAERSTSAFAILSNESFMNKMIIKTMNNHGNLASG